MRGQQRELDADTVPIPYAREGDEPLRFLSDAHDAVRETAW